METRDCSECGNKLTEKSQVVGSQLSSDDDVPDGAIYTTKCGECGAGNKEKVQELIRA